MRLALRAGHHAAFAHATQLWRAEQRLHLNLEPYLNHLAAANPALADAAGYYYGLLHFIVTPLVLAWVYLRMPAAFPRLRTGLVLATTGANIVFWTWPAAPPRFSVPGMTDILVTRDILGAANPRGATSLVNLYAAMPSLHVAWAAWCALAVITTTRSRWRHLAWLYPAATTFVVLASANHFLLDAAGGLAIAGLGMLATSRPARPPGRAARHASQGPGHAAARRPRAGPAPRGRRAGDQLRSPSRGTRTASAASRAALPRVARPDRSMTARPPPVSMLTGDAPAASDAARTGPQTSPILPGQRHFYRQTIRVGRSLAKARS